MRRDCRFFSLLAMPLAKCFEPNTKAELNAALIKWDIDATTAEGQYGALAT